jgi:hypothetical protein
VGLFTTPNILQPFAGPTTGFTGTLPPFPDLSLTRIAGPSILALGGRRGGLEAQMAGKRYENIGGGERWSGAFWFAGVAMFVVELGAGLDYVQAQLAAIVPSFLGNVPVLAFAGWNIAESVFWNRQHLEAMLRIMPFATLPFVLLALAFSMKQRAGFARQHAATN